MTKQAAKTLDQPCSRIALDHLFIETLETRNGDRMDFHEVSVWGVKSALMAAYEARPAGREAGLKRAKVASLSNSAFATTPSTTTKGIK